MNLLNYIIWNPDPVIFVIPGLNHPIVWYGLLFVLGFILSQQVMIYIFRKDGKPEKDVEKLTVYMVLATIIGARLGHCLFYGPLFDEFNADGVLIVEGYLSHPLNLLKIWEGGLASHGGALGIIFALYLFSRKLPYSFFWITDRIAIVAVLTGFLIRTGNLMNSEMEGKETKANYGVVYAWRTQEYLASQDRDVETIDFRKGGTMLTKGAGDVPLTVVLEYKEGVKFDLEKQRIVEGRFAQGLHQRQKIVEHIDFGGLSLSYRTYENAEGRAVVEIYGLGKARHAAQMYEAFYCLLLTGLFFWFWTKRDQLPAGFNFAMFLMVLWTGRFFDEYFKMNQVDFEEGMALNMGQWLSIPLILTGAGIMIWIYNRKDGRTMKEG